MCSEKNKIIKKGKRNDEKGKVEKNVCGPPSED